MASARPGRDPALAAQLPGFVSDACIGYGDVPLRLSNVVARGALYEASRSAVLLDIPEIARLHITRDAIVTAALATDAAAALGPHLRRTPLLALMAWRDGLALNAAAVAGPDGAVLLVGATASGKSTLAVAAMKRGLRLMADDAAVVTLSDEGVRVLPVWPEMILWPDALAGLFKTMPAWIGEARGAVPWRSIAPERFCNQPMPLKAVYILSPVGFGDVELRPALSGFAKLQHRFLLPYHARLAAALSDPAVGLRFVGAVGACALTRTFVYPRRSVAETDALAGQLIEDCGWSVI